MKVLFEKVKYCENSQRSDDSTGKAMVVLFEKGRAMGNARKCHFRIGVCNKMPLLVEMGAGWCTFAEEGVEKLNKNAKCTVHLQIRET